MELLLSFFTLLAAACIAQMLIYKNEIKRAKGEGVYDQKRAETGATPEKIHQGTVRRGAFSFKGYR